MAFVLGEDIDQEIRVAFQSDTPHTLDQDDEIKNKFKEHKIFLLKHLNRKWDVSSLETYISQRIIPRGLRDRIVHLHTDTFLPKWKELCIDHGLAVMGLIVQEEKLQLISIQQQIQVSAQGLEQLKDQEEFTRQNYQLKKEIEKAQLNLKITKQGKYRRDVADFKKNKIFDLTIHRGRSKSKGHGPRPQSRQRRNKSHSDTEEQGIKSVIFLDQQWEEQENIPTQSQKSIPKKSRTSKTTQERTHTRSQKK